MKVINESKRPGVVDVDFLVRRKDQSLQSEMKNICVYVISGHFHPFVVVVVHHFGTDRAPDTKVLDLEAGTGPMGVPSLVVLSRASKSADTRMADFEHRRRVAGRGALAGRGAGGVDVLGIGERAGRAAELAAEPAPGLLGERLLRGRRGGVRVGGRQPEVDGRLPRELLGLLARPLGRVGRRARRRLRAFAGHLVREREGVGRRRWASECKSRVFRRAVHASL